MKKTIFAVLILVIFGFILFSLLNNNDFKKTVHNLHDYEHIIKETERSITPIDNTKHFMVSAFIDHRFDKCIRVISIIKRNSLQPLYCIYCNGSHCYIAEGKVEIHSDHFGFPFGASDILCQGEQTQTATHVTVSAAPNMTWIHQMHFLPIHNRVERDTFKFNFTTCISTLYGKYNNVLQFAQTMEIYKLLGVQHVVIYNTSCGPDLEKLLQHYKREGFLEIIPWPIDQFLNPSSGWNSQVHKGELQYYGQLVTLNECTYRNMYRSRYVLLNDIDEIIMPYKHPNLPLLMESLVQQHGNAGVFLVESHIIPKSHFEDSGKYRRSEWSNIPGINIMEYIYRVPNKKNGDTLTKMIINPRTVVQTSVHTTLQTLRDVHWVSYDVCHIVHVRVYLQDLQEGFTKDQMLVDSRVWDFDKKLIPNVDRALQCSGFLETPK